MRKPSAKLYIFLSATFLFHCSYSLSRSFKTLPDMDPSACYSETQDNLTVSVQVFTHQDCRQYFGYDLIKYGYRPLLLHINNNSDNLFLMKPSLSNIELVKSAQIAKLIEFPVVAILTAVGIPVLYHSYQATPFLGLVGVGLWYYNKKLERELLENTLDEESFLKITPFSTVKRLVFCNEAAFLSKFAIVLSNENQGSSLKFQIDLLQKKRNNDPFIPYLTPW